MHRLAAFTLASSLSGLFLLTLDKLFLLSEGQVLRFLL